MRSPLEILQNCVIPLPWKFQAQKPSKIHRNFRNEMSEWTCQKPREMKGFLKEAETNSCEITYSTTHGNKLKRFLASWGVRKSRASSWMYIVKMKRKSGLGAACEYLLHNTATGLYMMGGGYIESIPYGAIPCR